MTKAEQRREALAQRTALSDAEYGLLCNRLLERFKTLDFKGVKALHIFLPIKNRKEPDTFPMIEWLLQAHPEIQILVPKADFSTFAMTQHAYPGKENLLLNGYDIPEPQNEINSGQPDMVIVPLLAFDTRGYRLGYGKGFYDRFLQGLSAQKIGLSFFDAITEIKDVHLNDIRLDKCITPHGVIGFV